MVFLEDLIKLLQSKWVKEGKSRGMRTGVKTVPDSGMKTWRKGPLVKKCGQPSEAGKDKERIHHRASRKRHSSVNILGLWDLLDFVRDYYQ